MIAAVAAASGLLAGVLHVVSGPDHLAAVAPLAAQSPGRAWRTGFTWAVGHAIGVSTIAVAAFFLRDVLPLQSLSWWSERLVGVVLIVIGLWTLRKALRHRLHSHEHTHGGFRHAHFHLHRAADPALGSAPGRHDGGAAHAHSHAPLGVGILHGFAGSSHLVAVLPSLFIGAPAAVAYLAGYGLGTVASMTTFSFLMGRWLPSSSGGNPARYRRVLGMLSAFAIVTGCVWLTAG